MSGVNIFFVCVPHSFALDSDARFSVSYSVQYSSSDGMRHWWHSPTSCEDIDRTSCNGVICHQADSLTFLTYYSSYRWKYDSCTAKVYISGKISTNRKLYFISLNKAGEYCCQSLYFAGKIPAANDASLSKLNCRQSCGSGKKSVTAF